MADLSQLEAAFIKADEAGNVDDAQAFATEIRRLRLQSQDTSNNGSVSKSLPANAGFGNLAAGIIGMPMDTVQNVANLGIAAYGATRTAMGNPDAAPSLISNIPGGSENVRQMMRSTGVSGLSPDNPNPNDSTGTAQYDFVSRGGFIPGGAIPAAASMAAEKFGGPAWGQVGAILPSALTQGYNAARAPSLANAQARNQVRDATLRPAQEAGYVFPPSEINGNGLTGIVESAAGKAAMKQAAEIKNQHVTNSLVRQELRIPPNTPLTEGLLNRLRNNASAPYQQVAAISPFAAQVLERLRDVRSQALDQWKHWKRQGVPDARRQAQALDTQADTLENLLESAATRSGRPELVNQMRESRTYIAKTYDIEKALNTGNGNIDAKIIGRALDRGRPLTGNLEVIGRFAEAFPKFARESSNTPAPNISALNLPAAGALATGGFSVFGAPGLALSTLPYVRGGLREMLLSQPYQRNFNQPNYTPAVMPENQMQMLLRQGVMSGQPQ